jgi:arylsulfatase A-like enzyme
VSPGGIAILLISGLVACSESGDSRPEARGVGHVARRLGADFDFLETPFHGAVARIGVEARPVLAEPETIQVASLLGITADGDGFVRAEFELPESLRSLPDAAFSLEIQQLPGEATVELIEKISRRILSRQILSGWRLEREPDGRTRIVYQHGEGGDTQRYSLHLQALVPGPRRLESRVFEVPPAARLELGYGLTTMPGAAGFEPVHFEVRLGCGGDPPRPVFEQTISPGEAHGWRDVALELPAAGGSCRLVLVAAGLEGAPVRGAVWAVPRIFVADEAPQVDVNVVLISLDTLRADHVSGFGYPRRTSPRIDAELIERGTRFLDVTSTYSRTDVSHMSLFTGLYPQARPEPGRLHAATPVPLLAERLREAGFDTAAFTEDGLLAGMFGFWFGFDRFTERTVTGPDRGKLAFDDALVYLRAHRERRFFMFVHTYKTHAPYLTSPAYAEFFRDPAEWQREGMSPVPQRHRERVDDYDRTIREADALVGRLLDELEALALADRTLVVLLSDHGESFGEHGVVGHSFSAHQEVIRVPLVLRGPGIPQGLAVETPVSLVDVAPTLLDWLELPPLEHSQGISLAPGLHREPLPEDRVLHFSWLGREAAGFRSGPLKYKRLHNRKSLFNLAEDPREKHAIGDRGQGRPFAEALIADHEEKSARIRADFETADSDLRAPALPAETQESLRALGYIE